MQFPHALNRLAAQRLEDLRAYMQKSRLARRLTSLGLSEAAEISTHTTMAERLQLFELARQGGPVALEVGSYLGSSACFIAAGLSGKGGRIYCLDTWNNETMPEGKFDTYKTFTENTRGFSDRITPLRKTSAELNEADIITPLDLVFLDGDHNEDVVGAEFDKIGPWVRKEGVIAFHDCVWFPGVTKTIGRALRSGDWFPAGQVDNLMWIRRR
jgi:predicted O-methyltransferase YrrM